MEQVNFNDYNKITHDLIIRHLNQNEVLNSILIYFVIIFKLCIQCPKNLVLLKELAKIIDETIKFTELKVTQLKFNIKIYLKKKPYQNNGVNKVFYFEKSLPKSTEERNVEYLKERKVQIKKLIFKNFIDGYI